MNDDKKPILTLLYQKDGKIAIENPITGEIIATDFLTEEEARMFINNYKG